MSAYLPAGSAQPPADTRGKGAPELRLPRQLRLGEDAHVDDVPAPLPVHPALRARRELRALHAHDALVRVQRGRAPPRALRGGGFVREHRAHARLEPADEARREGVAERGVRDDARALEEARGAHALGAVDDLRREHKVARGDGLAQRADRGEREHRAHAEGLERGDVRAGGHGGGREGVSDAVPREEGDLCPRGQRADGDGRAGESPGLEAVQFMVRKRVAGQVLAVSGLTSLLAFGVAPVVSSDHRHWERTAYTNVRLSK